MKYFEWWKFFFVGIIFFMDKITYSKNKKKCSKKLISTNLKAAKWCCGLEWRTSTQMSYLTYVRILAWHLVCFSAGYLSTLKELTFYPEKGVPTLGTPERRKALGI